jgi:hypothetical protein
MDSLSPAKLWLLCFKGMILGRLHRSSGLSHFLRAGNEHQMDVLGIFLSMLTSIMGMFSVPMTPFTYFSHSLTRKQGVTSLFALIL